jgi:cell filamentation protein
MTALTDRPLTECTPCRPGSVDTVADRIARVHAELLFIHPFHEGNGRLARWLADLMSMQARCPAPIYGFTGNGSMTRRVQYLNAVIQGYSRDYAVLSDFFRDAILTALIVE